jgi:hypothetical protein
MVKGKHTVALHDAQEFDNNFGRWADEDLALATAFCVDYVVLYHHMPGSSSYEPSTRFSGQRKMKDVRGAEVAYC